LDLRAFGQSLQPPCGQSEQGFFLPLLISLSTLPIWKARRRAA
jgi:hypothetical protein